MLYTIVAIYLVIINLIGIFVMWSDKRKAKKGAWRIKERTLFLVALLGGCLGTTIGMYWFRHKTQHWYFKYGNFDCGDCTGGMGDVLFTVKK